MEKKKIIAVCMIGMNRGSQGDSDHPFIMKDFEKKYSIHWMKQVSNKEKTGSTLFYELLKAVDTLCEKNNIDPGDVKFIFGRGTIGKRSEKDLAKALEKYTKKLGKDAFKVIIAKSYGVIDSLRAFKILGSDAEKKIGRINVMFCIDGYGPVFSRRSVSKRVKVGRKKESRFKIPSYFDKVYAIVQRNQGSKGLKAGKDCDRRIENFVVKQSYVDSFKKVYDHYADGFVRKLDVIHFNMDEIVSVIPCCKKKDKKFCTFADSILENYS